MNQSERQLFEAVSTGDAATVKQLVGTVSVDIQDETGKTPLTAAIEQGLDNMVEILLDAKADPTFPNKNGLTPLDVASERGNMKIVKILHTASASARDDAHKIPNYKPPADPALVQPIRRKKAVMQEGKFNHAIHNLLEDNLSEDSDDDIPETKDQQFEFSNSYSIMRLLKMLLFVQIVALMVDHPAAELSIIFRIVMNGLLSYSTTFYSRPFLDLIYVIQYFLQSIVNFARSQDIDTPNSKIEVSTERRSLSSEPYEPEKPQPPAFGASLEFLDEGTWHAAKYYGHYFLGILFMVMAVLFTIRFWEISDYSNRAEVREWLKNYVADGWWRRGGLYVAKYMAQGYLTLALVCYIIWLIANQFGPRSLPEARIIGAALAAFASVVFIVWVLGFVGIKFTESAFERYVSQNVSYTSSIILKRVLKAKTDMGFVLMCLLYMPVVYTLLQSLIVVTDWNDYTAPKRRRDFNYFVPCYYMAFPPYREKGLPVDTCPVASQTLASGQETVTNEGFFKDSNIVSCDTYFGVTLYVFSATMFVYVVLGVGYILYSFVSLITREFKNSKQVDVLHKLMRIQEEEEAEFNERFSVKTRYWLVWRNEFVRQIVSFRLAIAWVFTTAFQIVKHTLKFCVRPIVAIILPFKFLGERLAVVSCLNFLTAEGTARKQEMELLRKQRLKALRRTTSSRNLGNNSRSQSMRSIVDSEKSSRPRTPVNFNTNTSGFTQSSRIQLDEEDYSTKKSENNNPDWVNTLRTNCIVFLRYVTQFDYISSQFSAFGKRITREVMRSGIVVWIKLQQRLLIDAIWPPEVDEFGGQAGHGLINLGGSQAPWRIERTLQNKFRLLQRLEYHLIVELRLSKGNYIAEHELLISVFDYTIDSAALFLPVILYNYYRFYWFLVVFTEMTLLAVIAALTKILTTWQIRNYAFIAVMVVFGSLSYVFNPYTEEQDRWLEFVGRCLVCIIAAGLIQCDVLIPDATNGVDTFVYEPWKSSSYWRVLFTSADFGLYEVIDIFITVFLLCYILYVLNMVGVFGALERAAKSVIFKFNDHILDFLINIVDDKIFGFENMYVGLRLLQQWDDIIKSQRRYALLTWPDVRPPTLLSFAAKLFEVKWASLFNLTLGNLRSSLGLTVLHTVIFSSDSEVARWIMHTNPELLYVEDSQKDTPISIALKECAYMLLAYGEQNGGSLDDGTSYSDEHYQLYYPEVEDLRDEVFLNGEFIADYSTVVVLDSTEMIRLREEFYYLERGPNAKRTTTTVNSPTAPKNERKDVSKLNVNSIMGNKKAEDSKLTEKEERKKKKISQQKLEKIRQLKESVYANRFPEDSMYENHENGQMGSWAVIGLTVPDDNIFLDTRIMKRTMHDSTYKYYDHDSGEEEDWNQKKPIEEKDEDADSDDLERGTAKNIIAEAVVKYHHVLDKDLRYVIPTTKAVTDVQSNLVPWDHPQMRDFVDWDRRRKGRRQSQRRDSKGGIDSGRPWTAMSVVSTDAPSVGSGSTTATKKGRNLNSAKIDREVRWKICKFAEILMSVEISKISNTMHWEFDSFKAFNKLASAMQGRVAQQLAMACHFNPPPGFVRISDWSGTDSVANYDEAPEENLPMIVKGVVTLFEMAKKVKDNTKQAVEHTLKVTNLSGLKGRARRMRSASSFSQVKDKEDGASEASTQENAFPDRIVNYLAESFAASTSKLVLNDFELSYNGRKGWRAIARALRRVNCSFILPSVFVGPRTITLLHLELTKNELDCGDAVYIADILVRQTKLQYVDLSYNRIGARGMTRMCVPLKDHKSIRTFRIDHNIIGPAAGKPIGIWLKNSVSLKVLSMSHNRMGEIIRFPTMYSRENIKSAVHDIFVGLRFNKSVESLDVSYNHLGPDSSLIVPNAVLKHPCLHTLNFSGNDVGQRAGAQLLFGLAGLPNGEAFAKEREKFIKRIQMRQIGKDQGSAPSAPSAPSLADAPSSEAHKYVSAASQVANEDSSVVDEAQLGGQFDNTESFVHDVNFEPESPKKRKKIVEDSNTLESSVLDGPNYFRRSCQLMSLSVADNQLGPFAGHAIAALLERNKAIAHLDISGNSLSHKGIDLITDQIELLYGIKPREFLKLVLWEIEESKYTGRNAKKRKKVYTNLTSLNLSRNGIGPDGVSSIMVSLANPNCTIIDLDISNNPLGYTVQMGGKAFDAAADIRLALESTKSLRYLNLSRTSFLSMELVTFFGGMMHNESLEKFTMQDVIIDESSCLQLVTAVDKCEMMTYLDIKNARIGASGGEILARRICDLTNRLIYVDLTGNLLGPVSAVYLGDGLRKPDCSIETLKLAQNDLMEEGGIYLTKSLIGNLSITYLDLSSNNLSKAAAFYLSDAVRGLFQNGKKVADSRFRSIIINDNPDIGPRGAKHLAKSLANERITNLQIRNIGAKPGTAAIIAKAIRDPTVAWQYLDVGNNELSRIGLNQIFWALRQNKRLRIFKCGENKAGTKFCSNSDNLLKHGISVPRCLRNNVVLRELDLSFNGISSEAATNILDAMVDNHTIKKLSLRGNLLDDTVALTLPDLLRCNNVLEELDLGQNRMGFSCCYAIAESLEINRSLKVLLLDYNRFGGSGIATLDIFSRSIMMNYSLQVLVFDGNKLGPEWGVRLAETFARNNTLTQVSLRDNRLDSRAGTALLKSYRKCPYLLELGLSSDEIGKELWEQFRVEFDLKRACVSPDSFHRMDTQLTTKQKVLLESYE